MVGKARSSPVHIGGLPCTSGRSQDIGNPLFKSHLDYTSVGNEALVRRLYRLRIEHPTENSKYRTVTGQRLFVETENKP